MEWYNFLSCFFSGAFLANAVPHFVYGICGDKFPTPFAKPPGQGLSSPLVNVVWGLFNIIIGYLLFGGGHMNNGAPVQVILFFVGAALMSIMLALNFQKKHKE